MAEPRLRRSRDVKPAADSPQEAEGPSASWAAWWNERGGADSLDEAEWRCDAEDFVAAIAPLLGYGPDDDVLDVGCGPGSVVEALAGRVRSVVGVDVAPRMIDAARARLAGRANIELLALDPARSTDLSVVGSKRFSIVICNSVVQYLHDAAEAEALITSIRGVCAPSARVLVSDLAVGGGRWSDAWGLVRGAWRRGRLREAWRRIARMRRSTYAATRERLGLLVVDPERLAAVARSLGGAAEILDAPLTMLANRRHLFVRF
jgi:SAM-dependent methyltransferase